MAKDRILAMRRMLADLHSQSAVWAWLLTLGAAAAYLVCFAGAAFADAIGIRLLNALALGPLIALLFRIAHDAGHGSHIADAWLARIIGQVSQLPSYHPYSIWLLLHNGRHHSFTNLRDRDYIWIPLSKAEYDALPPLGRMLERAYRTMPGLGLYYLYAIWWRKMAMPTRAFLQKDKSVYRVDRVILLVFFLGQLAVLTIGAASLPDFAVRILLAIVFPFAVFGWLVGFASLLNHTHPDVPWFARREEWDFYTGQVNCTVHMQVPSWMVFFLTDVGLHGAHHIDPRIPIWSLDKAEPRIVASAAPEIVFDKWTLRRHCEIMRRCKLYDYDTHQWLDFAGQPTGPELFTTEAKAALQPSALRPAFAD